MLKSMNSGVSGLRAHQTFVDVTANNIANVNTTGFKGSRVLFSDVMSQNIKAGNAGNANQGGVNPSQVGLGVMVSAVARNSTGGTMQNTGNSGDLALQGDGFFVVRAGGEQMYTRAGAFQFDDSGNLTTPGGQLVQGWMADPITGVVNPNGPLTNLNVPSGMTAAPVTTRGVTMGGNLPSDAAVGDTFNTSISVFDSLGGEHLISVAFEKTGDNTWEQTATGPTGALTPATVTLTFSGTDGQLVSSVPAPNYSFTPAGVDPVAFTVDYGTSGSAGAMTQYGGDNTAAAVSQDGRAAGVLNTVGIADGGILVGSFSNGTTQVLGQVAVALATNAEGMESGGGNLFRAGLAAGNISIGLASTGGRASVTAGALESSNVDLGQAMTDLIIGQRGFQVNSKSITTADEMLQELTQLKR